MDDTAPERPKRATLHLKLAPKTVAPELAKALTWKCKPCGKSLQVDDALADSEAVRCPSCKARLGVAGDFRSEPPGAKLRARLVDAE